MEKNKRKIKLKRREAKWIEHPWAEEENGLLIPNYACTHCHTWKRDYSNYCPECGYKMTEVIYRNENNNH